MKIIILLIVVANLLFNILSQRKNKKFMSEFATQVNEKFARINTATNNIAADIRILKGQLAGNPTEEEKAAILEKLEAHAVTLEGVAAETPEETTATPETPVS